MYSLVYTGSPASKDGKDAYFAPRTALPFDDHPVVTIGRAVDNSVKLYSSRLPEAVRTAISRFHAQVSLDQHGLVAITDLGGSNGTFLGGRRLRPHEPEPWPVGTEVVFGGNSGILPGEMEASWRAGGKQLMRVFAFRLERGGGSGGGGGAAGASGDAVTDTRVVLPSVAPPPAAEPAPLTDRKRPRQGSAAPSDADTELSAGEGGGGGGGGGSSSGGGARGASTGGRSHGKGGAAPAAASPPSPAPPFGLSPLPPAGGALAALSCRSCRALPVAPLATACGHLFCGACFEGAAGGQARAPGAGLACPHCAAPLATAATVAALLASVGGGGVGAEGCALAALCTPLPCVAEACAALAGEAAGAAAAAAAAAPPPPHRAPMLLLARALLAQTLNSFDN
jgi:hypothetical protein